MTFALRSLIRPLAVAAAALFLFAAVPARAAGLKKEKPGHPVVLLKTTFGAVYIELFPEEAPKTVETFTALAEGKREFTDIRTGKKVKRPFYDGLIFHRVIKNFMIQGGDPKGDGTGGPGFRFEDEINANSLGLDKLRAVPNGKTHPYLSIQSQRDFQQIILAPLVKVMGIRSQEQFTQRLDEVKKRVDSLTVKEVYENLGYRYSDKLKSRPPTKGVIAMANAGPNTNGSQFFINLADTPWLSGKHTVFGKVVKGMEVVEKIGETPVGPANKPKKEVRIESIRLYPSAP